MTLGTNKYIIILVRNKSYKLPRQAEKGDSMEDMSVFKSYLRRLLQDLKDLKEALKNKEYDKAEKMVDRLIDDTQKGIEDN